MLPGLISLSAIALAAILVTRVLRPAGLVDAFLFYVPIFVAHVLVAGFALSALNELNRLYAWSIASGVLLVPAAASYLAMRLFARARLARVGTASTATPTEDRVGSPSVRFRGTGLSRGDKLLIAMLLFTALVLAVVNFELALNVAPHNWDSMTYHLARMAYYLQHGNLSAYDANFYAQVIHPKNSTLLLLYTYLVSGRHENLTQLVQFVAYGVAIAALYGICRRLGRDRYSSLFAALVFALLIECLMQATTTQNDMLLTAFAAIVVYGLLGFRERSEQRYLLLAGLSAGIMLGVKASALLTAPSLAVTAAWALLHRNGRGWRSLVNGRIAGNVAVLTLALTAGGFLFALPSGYLENWRLFGNPIGPESGPALEMRKITFEGESASYILANGTRNLLRYAFEFLSLDGLPRVDVDDCYNERTTSRVPVPDEYLNSVLGNLIPFLQRAVRAAPAALVRMVGLDLETQQATRMSFRLGKLPASHEDHSYWGIFGFALVWPLTLLALLGLIKEPGMRVLALSATLFVLAQAYCGQYDPWRGRFFLTAAVFAVPLVACCTRYPNRLWRGYLTGIVLLGCLSAFTAVWWRASDRPWQMHLMTRLQQLTCNRYNYYEAIRHFDEQVPHNATVALFLGWDRHAFEYPLFGAGLTRTLIPINSFWRGPQAIPLQADYLLYSAGMIETGPGDIHLGEDWYLRKLGLTGQPAELAGTSNGRFR